jgi:transcriptional regulator with XRE-family HTH domain
MDEGRKKLGHYIRRIREAKGLSRDIVADRIDMQRDTLGAIERGEAWPRLPTLLKLTDVLGLDWNRLPDIIQAEPQHLPTRGADVAALLQMMGPSNLLRLRLVIDELLRTAPNKERSS